jgi:hypothetical protein
MTGASTTSSRALRRPATLLGALLLASYASFMPPPAWNETSRFDLVRSLVERHRIDIDPFQENTADKALRAGHHYSDKAPGASLLAAPAYAVYYGWLRAAGRPPPQFLVRPPSSADEDPQVMFSPTFRRAVYVCNLATNALAGAALGALFFLVLGRAGVAPRLALAATLALSAGSLVFPYATMLFGHVLAAALLFGAFALLGPFAPGARGEGAPGRGRLLAAGALCGLAVLTELPTALGALALAVYLARRGDWRARMRGLLLFGAGAAPALLALAAYQRAAFGSPFSAGYGHVEDPRFAAGMAHGLYGIGAPSPAALAALLLGRARGLLYVAPVLVLGFVGLARAARAASPVRAEARVAGAIVVGLLLVNAGYYMWWGGAALGPRHFIPALPLLCFGIPFALRGPRPALLATAGLTAISALNQVLATAVSPLPPFEGDVLFGHVYAHFFRGEVAILSGAANAGMLLGLRGPASLLPLLLLWAVALPVIVASLDRAGPRVPVEAPTSSG